MTLALALSLACLAASPCFLLLAFLLLSDSKE